MPQVLDTHYVKCSKPNNELIEVLYLTKICSLFPWRQSTNPFHPPWLKKKNTTNGEGLGKSTFECWRWYLEIWMAVVELGWVQGAVHSVEGSKMEKATYRLRSLFHLKLKESSDNQIYKGTPS